MKNDAHFVAIDWGSTNARAMLFNRDGSLLADTEHPLGIKNITDGRFAEGLERMTSDWRREHGEMMTLLSGMIGSRTGWHEAPYFACPAALDELHRALVSPPATERVFIVPGLKMAGDRSDVMRGEELQLLGLASIGTGIELVCMPGTHSKWVRTEANSVREFHTAMTGELFAAITQHTLFSGIIPKSAAAMPLNEAAFAQGLKRSEAAHGFTTDLFGFRADLLLGKIAAPDLADAISGLFIGTEIRHLRHLAARDARVALLAAPGLRERYEFALRFFSLEPVAFDAREITARGFAAIHAAMEL